MPTITRRSTVKEKPFKVGTLAAKVFQWATIKHDVTTLTERQNALRNEFLSAISEHGEVDEKGSQFLTLPDPVEVAGQTIKVLKRERRVSAFFDQEKAEELLAEKGLLDRCQKEVTIVQFDQDEVYILQQEGLLTEAELDSLFGQSVSFAFKPLAA